VSLPSAVSRERTTALAAGPGGPQPPDTAGPAGPEPAGAGAPSAGRPVPTPAPRTRLRRVARGVIRRAEGRLLVDTRAELLAMARQLQGLEARVAELERGWARDRTAAVRVALLEADAADRSAQQQRLAEEVATLRAAMDRPPEPPAEGPAP
jgi:hypothetical protein